MRRGLVTVLLVLVVVLAGCSGVFGGDGTPTETVTPAAVPTDEPTETPVPQFAPGLTGRGVENASALLDAHTSVLEDRSFAMRANTTAIAPNGSVVFHSTSTLRAGPPGTAVYSLLNRNGSLGYPGEIASTRTVWSNGTFSVVRQTYSNNTTTYDRFQTTPERRSVFARSSLRYTLEPFGIANTSVTKRERNDTTLYLVRGRIRTDEGAQTDNRSLRMLVDSRGVVHESRVTTRLSDENVSLVVSETRFSNVGTTDAPERPSWVAAAIRTTTAASRPTAFVDTATNIGSNATRTSTTPTPVVADSS